MIVKNYSELMVVGNNIKAQLDLYLNELDKCKYAAKDIPVEAMRKRLQPFLSEIENDIKTSQEIITTG